MPLGAFTCSISVKWAWSLKLCPGSKKCLSKGPPFGLDTSCRWVLIRRLAGGSLFPTYCDFGQSMQCDRYMEFLLLQFRLCRIFSTSPVVWLEKVFVDTMCLQHRFLLDVRQAWQPVILACFWGRIFLLLERWVWPIRSRRFLLRR